MIEYKELDKNSKVWIYQSNQAFKEEDVPKIEKRLASFTQNWTSHNNELKAYGSILHQRFIVFIVDESMSGASGCSIDKSVHFVQEIARDFEVDLFDRMNFAYKSETGNIDSANKESFSDLYNEGQINDETLIYNNLVRTKEEFESNWEIPLGKSWHKNLISN